MRPRTKLNRVRFTDEETAGLAGLAKRLSVPKAALVRAFVRRGLAAPMTPTDVTALRALLAADAVKRGREYGELQGRHYAKRAA